MYHKKITLLVDDLDEGEQRLALGIVEDLLGELGLVWDKLECDGYRINITKVKEVPWATGS